MVGSLRRVVAFIDEGGSRGASAGAVSFGAALIGWSVTCRV